MDELLEIVKSQTGHPFADEVFTNKIKGFINQSKSRLSEIGGREIDFIADLQAQELLVNRVNYQLNDCLDDFEKNYRHELMALFMRYGGDSDDD